MSSPFLTPAPRPGSPASFRPPPSTTAGGRPGPAPVPSPPSPPSPRVRRLAALLDVPVDELADAIARHPAGRRRPTERTAP